MLASLTTWGVQFSKPRQCSSEARFTLVLCVEPTVVDSSLSSTFGCSAELAELPPPRVAGAFDDIVDTSPTAKSDEFGNKIDKFACDHTAIPKVSIE